MMTLTTGVSDGACIRRFHRSPPPVHADGSRKSLDRRGEAPLPMAVDLDACVAREAHDVEGPVRRGVVHHEQLEVSMALLQDAIKGLGDECLTVPGGHA